MKKFTRVFAIIAAMVVVFSAMTMITFAADDENEETAVETTVDNSASAKAIAAAIAIAMGAAAGAIGMGIAIAKSSESIARQPEAVGDIRTSMMLGLVFIETAIIYALIVAILIIFVL
jgi:F-type H+-transporting ATPase subunit c